MTLRLMVIVGCINLGAVNFLCQWRLPLAMNILAYGSGLCNRAEGLSVLDYWEKKK